MEYANLTDVTSLRFGYRVLVDGVERTIALDVEEIALEMYSGLSPDTFAEVEPGKLGLAVVIECYVERKPVPSNLPDILSVLRVAKRALRVPEECGIRVTMEVLKHYLSFLAEMNKAKKDTPDSPASSASTPASSAGATSAKTSSAG